MNAFRWIDFVSRHHIGYDEGGAHTARNNIYIRCPFCGDDKRRLGLSLETSAWGCWRDRSHRGWNPVRLVKALLGCSQAQAVAEVEQSVPTGSLDTLMAQLRGLDTPPPLPADPEPQEFGPGFQPIRPAPPPMRYAYRYLQDRGFFTPKALGRYYHLRFATWRHEDPKKDFQGRIIFPFYFRGRLVGWTGRTIRQSDKIKYRSWPEGKLPSRILYNFDRCSEGGDLLVLVEGPLDTLKVDWFGKRYGVRAAGLLGLHFDSHRVGLVDELMKRFDRLAIMLDSEALPQALDMSRMLAHHEPQILQIPWPWGDPGEIPGAYIPEAVGVS